MRDWDFDDRSWYPPSRPRRAKGGIRAQSQRGGFAEHWWARRWIETLESFDIASRLQRGRSYARRGQVTSLRIDAGIIDAQVQGSRPKPYTVSIKIRTLTPAEWEKVLLVVAGRAAYAARLLAGEMPQDIEQAFATARVSLFPERSRELATGCTCPDWSNPCKHIAAVYYLVGEEFDRDPFLLFRLRGLDRQHLMERLGGAAAAEQGGEGAEVGGFGADRGDRTAGVDGEGEGGVAGTRHGAGTDGRRGGRRRKESPGAMRRERHRRGGQPAEDDVAGNPVPLAAQLARFWQSRPIATGFFGVVQTPGDHAALVRRLGRFPFWRGERPIVEAMGPAYARAAQRAFQVFVSAAEGEDGAGETLHEGDET